MLKKILTLFLISFLGINTSFAQNISGKVLGNKSKKGIEKVSVYLTSNNRIGVTTNKTGVFVLKINSKVKDTDSITFSLIGYKTRKITVQLLKRNSQEIILSKETNYIDEVVVKNKKRQSKLKFKKIASLDSGVFSFASLVVGNKLYISGGDKTIEERTYSKAIENAFEKAFGTSFVSEESIMREWDTTPNFKGYSDVLFIYDLEKNTLKKSKVKFQKRAYHQINFYNDNLYVLGGKNVKFNKKEYLLNTIEVLNIDSLQVQTDNVNPHQAVNFNSFVYKDYLIVVGGSVKINKKGKKVFIDKIHLFNLKTGLWHEIGKMPNPRETSGILVDDKIFLVGGYKNKPVSFIESWDLTNNEWKLEGDLFTAFKKPAITSHKKNIYIYDYGKLLIYNNSEKSLKEYKIGLHLKEANIHFYKNSLYIIGGYIVKHYGTEPSTGVYKIKLTEFAKTKVNRFKKLNKH